MVKHFGETIGPVRFKVQRRKIQPENVPLQQHLPNTSSGMFNRSQNTGIYCTEQLHTGGLQRKPSGSSSPGYPVIHEIHTKSVLISSMPASIVSPHLNSHSSD